MSPVHIIQRDKMITAPSKPAKIAFTNANVVTMLNRTILENQTVVVENGGIKFIGNSQRFNTSEDTFMVDAHNKYLMPGLIDMHVHLGDNKDDLLLFLVNGVTTIRNMWGYENFRLLNWIMGTRVFNHRQLRDRINEGNVLGPSIFSAGPMLEGAKPFFPRFMIQRVKTDQRAEAIVREQATKGYDLIKFYSTVSKTVFKALVSAAKENKISIAGHVPDEVGLKEVIKAKVSSVEHLLGFFNPYNPHLAIAESDVDELIQLSVENSVYHCPTLIASERICNIESLEQYKNESELAYLPKRVRKAMEFLLKTSSKLFKKKELKPNHEYLPFLFTIVQKLNKQGDLLLLGTDKATPYVIAGFSIHRELQLLCKAGLTPFDAIKAGTVNAANCLGQAAEIGTVEVGKRADLLLVDKNPLADLETIKSHCGVMVRGNWFSREKCNEILAELKAKNQV